MTRAEIYRLRMRAWLAAADMDDLFARADKAEGRDVLAESCRKSADLARDWAAHYLGLASQSKAKP